MKKTYFFMILLLSCTILCLSVKGQCGSVDADSTYQSSNPCSNTTCKFATTGECNFYGHQDTYIPDLTTPLRTPPVTTLKIAFHIFNRADGTKPFIISNDPEKDQSWIDQSEFDDWIDWVNEALSTGSSPEHNSFGPSDPVPGVVTTLPNGDARIRVELVEVHNYFNDTLHSMNALNGGWATLKAAVEASGNWNDNIIPYFFTTSGENRVNDIGNYNVNYESMIQIVPQPYSHYRLIILHELGHLLDLKHLRGHENLCNSSGKDFIDDVYSNTWTCNCNGMINATIDTDLLTDDCITNNIMQYNNPANYISPKQAGRMHRTLHLGNMRKYIDGCPYSDVALEINQDEIWDFDIRMFRDIVVKTGNTLTINCRVNMPSEGRIIVERGARLIINGTITNACEGEAWKGIEVWGNSSVAHSSSMRSETYALQASDPGVIIFKDGCIANAEDAAIYTMRRDMDVTNNCFVDAGSSYYGGLVYGKNAAFHNNPVGVDFRPYSFKNTSLFDNCNFTVTDEYNDIIGLKILDNHGIRINSSNFEMPTTIANDHGRGIDCMNSGIEVLGSNFTNLYAGIVMTNTVPINHPSKIGWAASSHRNSFNDNAHGIVAFSPNQLDVYNNYFSGGGNGDGIYITGEGSYKVRYCDFENIVIGVWGESTGVFDNNIVEKNNFNNAHGIWLAGNNRGFEFACNDFDTDVVDFYLQNAGSFDGEINEFQGSSTSPANNKFSSNCTHSCCSNIATLRNSNGNPLTEPFTYFHRVIESEYIPSCSDLAFTIFKEVLTDSNTCPENPPPSPCRTINLPCYLLEQVSDEILGIKDVLNFGSSSNLSTALELYPDDYNTLNLLEEADAFVSDDNLRLATAQPSLPQWQKEEVLLTNAPLSDSLMLVSSTEVSDPVYSLLYDIKNTVSLSERTQLRIALKEKTVQQNLLINGLIEDAIATNDLTAIEYYEDLIPMRKQYGAVVRLGDTENAQDYLSILSTDSEEDVVFKEVQNIALQYEIEGLEMELTEDQSNYLRDVANSNSVNSGYARSLLYILLGEGIDDIELPVFQANKRGLVNNNTEKIYPKPQRLTKSLLYINPNPVSDFTNIRILEANSTRQNQIKVLDVQGNLVKSINLEKNQKSIQANFSDLKEGIYFVVLETDNAMLAYEKLMILK